METGNLSWEERLRHMLDEHIAEDGGAVATRYFHKIIDFCRAEIEAAEERGRLDVLAEVEEKLSRYTVIARETKRVATFTTAQFMSLMRKG